MTNDEDFLFLPGPVHKPEDVHGCGPIRRSAVLSLTLDRGSWDPIFRWRLGVTGQEHPTWITDDQAERVAEQIGAATWEFVREQINIAGPVPSQERF